MSQEHADQILDYLNGHLDDEARAAFESALATDVELREETELQRRINDRLKELAAADRLRPLVERVHKAYTAAPPPPQERKLPRWWSVAAILVLGLLATWLVARPTAADRSRQLASKYQRLNHPASVLPSPTVLRAGKIGTGPSAPPTDPVGRARWLVAEDSLVAALRAYQLISDAALTDSLRFETALLHLELGQPAMALRMLRRVPAAPFAGGPYWYRALAHLYLGERKAAQTLLEKLVNEYERPYRLDALALLEELGPIK